MGTEAALMLLGVGEGLAQQIAEQASAVGNRNVSAKGVLDELLVARLRVPASFMVDLITALPPERPAGVATSIGSRCAGRQVEIGHTVYGAGSSVSS